MDETLCGLLYAVSEDFDDRTAVLVAADRATEIGEHTLETFLRAMAEHRYRAFLFTGSRRYGTPRPDSDFDWVWHVTHETARDAFAAAGAVFAPDAPSTRGLDAALRLGPVNILVVTGVRQWNAWVDGTLRLDAEKPVTRARAVEVFREGRAKRGLREGGETSGDPPKGEEGAAE